MRTILSDDEINRMMSDYRSKGFSGEVLEIAEKDLRTGVTKEQQSWYMVKTFEPAKVRSLSEAIREHLPDSLIKLLYRLDRYQIDVVVKQYKAGIPEEELTKVIHKKYSAHDMQMVFEKLQRELMKNEATPSVDNISNKESMEKQKDTNPEVQKNTEDTETEISSVEDKATTEDSTVDNDNSVENKTSDDISVIDEQNEVEQLTKGQFLSSLERMMEKFTDTIDNLVTMNTNSSIDPVAERRLNKTIDDMEKKIKSLNRELEMSAGIIATKESEIAGLKERMREIEKGQKTKTEQVQKNEPDKVKITSDMNMSMTMPDGSIVPVRIEHAEKKNYKGMAAVAARFFNGNPWQKSLLNMLIDGHLSKDQLVAIKKARDYHFSDQEIKELIESGLPAEEMSGIIEVVMADRR